MAKIKAQHGMQHQVPLTKADIPNLPLATRVQTSPALWRIEGYEGLFEYVNPKTPYENLSPNYKAVYERSGGLTISRNQV